VRSLSVASETHGESGLGYAAVPPAGVILDFVKSLERLLADQPEPVTLVTLGPVTSLALALRRDAALVRDNVKRHVAMIGNVAAQGNTTRYAEFNAWCDPEALDVVLRAELPTEMVGLDVTRQLVLAPSEATRLAHSGAPQAVWIQDALRFYMEFHKRQEGLEGCIVNDVLPIAEPAHPGLLTFEEQRLPVDLDEAEHRGHTRLAPAGAPADAALRADLGAGQPGDRRARGARVRAGAQPAPGCEGRGLGDRSDLRRPDGEAAAVRVDRAGGRARRAALELLERPPARRHLRALPPSGSLPR